MNKKEIKKHERDVDMLEKSILFTSGESFTQEQAMLALRLQPRTLRGYQDAPIRAWNAVAVLCNKGVCDLEETYYGNQTRYKRVVPKNQKE